MTFLHICFSTYFLTYSMEQSSWEANRFSAIQEIPGILRNPKVHYHITSAHNLSLSWARSIQTMPHIPLPKDPS